MAWAVWPVRSEAWLALAYVIPGVGDLDQVMYKENQVCLFMLGLVGVFWVYRCSDTRCLTINSTSGNP